MTQLLQQWQYVPSTNEKLVSALLFDQVKVSKPASKSETLQSRLKQPAPTVCLLNMVMLMTYENWRVV